MADLSDCSSQVDHDDLTPSAEIGLVWLEIDEEDETRKGTMYCFRNCEVNKN